MAPAVRCCAQATALDWAGDPIQVAGRFRAGHGEASFQEMLDHFRDYTDVVGDNPMNLGATTLGFTAYALTGERSYRDWVLEYVDAWVERTAANGGIVPTSVGLDGRIESATAGTAGSTAGTTPSCRSPGGGRSPTAARSSTAPTTASPTRCCSPATGGTSSPGAHARPGQRQREAGRRPDAVPHMYGRLDKVERLGRARIDDLPQKRPEGWYEFRPQPFAPGALELYHWTLDRSALDLLPETPAWVRYLDGADESFPERALQEDLEPLRARSPCSAPTRAPGHDDVGRSEPHQPGHDERAGAADAWASPSAAPATRSTAGCATSTPRGRAGCPSTWGRWWSA